MNTEDNLHLSKIERQVGTLKLAVLILGAALIYNSANKSGLLGEYKFVADKIEVKKIILKNSREVVGKIYSKCPYASIYRTVFNKFVVVWKPRLPAFKRA